MFGSGSATLDKDGCLVRARLLCCAMKPELHIRKGVQSCCGAQKQAPKFTHGVPDNKRSHERPPWLLYLIQRRGAILELHSIILNVVSRYTCALNISYRIAEFWLVKRSAYSTLPACSDVGRSCDNYGYFRQ